MNKAHQTIKKKKNICIIIIVRIRSYIIYAQLSYSEISQNHGCFTLSRVILHSLQYSKEQWDSTHKEVRNTLREREGYFFSR